MTLRNESDTEVLHAAEKWAKYSALATDWRAELARLLRELHAAGMLDAELKADVAVAANVSTGAIYVMARSR